MALTKHKRIVLTNLIDKELEYLNNTQLMYDEGSLEYSDIQIDINELLSIKEEINAHR